MNDLNAIQLDVIERQPKPGQANASIIWLHGLGASGDDFVPVIPRIKLNDETNMRFVFPHAPVRAITYFGGERTPAWYDFSINGVAREVDASHLATMVNSVEALIQAEIDLGIKSERIFIAGFSQGGALAYETVLNNKFKLAGLLAMSTYLPKPERVNTSTLDLNFAMHIYHGTQDDVVPMSLGQSSIEALQGKGFKPQVSHYEMAHTVCLEQLEDISQFLNDMLAERK
jgi:phospholipase/carboxylesterase